MRRLWDMRAEPLCAYCRKQPVDPAWRPFCSDRCRMADLGHWLSGDYRIQGDTIRATDLRRIKVADEDFGMMTYDPAFMNTASCRSSITFIDGNKGILRYRGYPIEQLAEKASFLEVAWLLRNGELPKQEEYDQFVHDITYHT